MDYAKKLGNAWLFLIISGILFSSISGANEVQPPTPLKGIFEFTGELEPVLYIDVKRVYGFTSEGKQELRELRAQGYSCQSLPRQTYRCLEQFKTTTLPEKMERKSLGVLESVSSLEFYDVEGDVSLETDGESYKMWRVHRSVSIANFHYENYEMSWTSSISKLTLRAEGQPTFYFNMDGPNTINRQISVSRTLDKNHFQIYIVRGIYYRSCFNAHESGCE